MSQRDGSVVCLEGSTYSWKFEVRNGVARVRWLDIVDGDSEE